MYSCNPAGKPVSKSVSKSVGNQASGPPSALLINTAGSVAAAGNLLLDPEAGLLFIDFSTGDTLHLSGHAEVLWDETSLPGAQRTVSFQTEEWVHVKGALPIQQHGSVESSPYNPTPPNASQVYIPCWLCLVQMQAKS